MPSQGEEHKTPGKRASAVKHTGKPVCIKWMLGNAGLRASPRESGPGRKSPNTSLISRVTARNLAYNEVWSMVARPEQQEAAHQPDAQTGARSLAQRLFL